MQCEAWLLVVFTVLAGERSISEWVKGVQARKHVLVCVKKKKKNE